VQLSAPSKHLLATAAGAYIRIEGDNIELGAPGKVEFKGTQREWMGAKGLTFGATAKAGNNDRCNEASVDAASAGAAHVAL
jgi:uncharacterized protein (DUF2345 family)